MSDRTLKPGDRIIYCDEVGGNHEALVTCVWDNGGKTFCTLCCINLVIVNPDEKMQDEYGRQIIHKTSISHKSQYGAHGFYWRFEDEEPNPYTAPSK